MKCRSILLELAVQSAEEARLAECWGADRIELSATLEVGGLTPDLEVIRETCAQVRIPVMILIRPRAGDFAYSSDELARMALGIREAFIHGASGVVFGALTDGGTVDEAACEKLLEACAGRKAVFHRAFDEVIDPFAGLEQLSSIGFCRVLTSGGAAGAADPASLVRLRELVDRAGQRLEILPGGGIRASNVARIVQATGCTQVHSSGRAASSPGFIPRLDAATVAELCRELDRL